MLSCVLAVNSVMVCFEIVGRPELVACSPFKREGFAGLLHICRLSLILSAADKKKQSQQGVRRIPAQCESRFASGEIIVSPISPHDGAHPRCRSSCSDVEYAKSPVDVQILVGRSNFGGYTKAKLVNPFKKVI